MSHAGPDSSSPGDPAPERIPEHLVDQFFDRELDDDARRAFLRSLPRDLDQCAEVAKTRRMLDLLKAGSATAHDAAPDLTGRIIAAVDHKRGFASHRVRRIARVARMALAASVLLFVGALATVERIAPDATRLTPAPAPLTTALRESQAEMASTLGSVTSTIETIQMRVEGVAPRAMAQHAHERIHAGLAPVFTAGFTPDEHAAARTPEHAPVNVNTGVNTEIHVVGVAFGRAHAVPPQDAERSKHLPGPRRVVVDHGRDGQRRVAVGIAMFGKRDPTQVAWTIDMAPAAQGGHAPSRLIDAEGRCSAFVLPLGIDRGGIESGPFVLPGQNMARMASPVLPQIGPRPIAP